MIIIPPFPHEPPHEPPVLQALSEPHDAPEPLEASPQY